MQYHSPETVVHPKTFIKKVEIIFDGGPEGFSLAILNWDGLDHAGIRWNVAFKETQDPEKVQGNMLCHGSPATGTGKPTWFVLPREFFHPDTVRNNPEQLAQLLRQWQQPV